MSKTYNLTKKSIDEFPFHLILEDEEFKKSLPIYGLWLLPQALAYIGNKKVVGDSAVETAKSLISTCEHGTLWAKGLIQYVLMSPRGTILPKSPSATKQGCVEYSALVPLFLAAFKKYQNIPYNHWSDPTLVMDKDLATAIKIDIPEWSKAELLDFRNLGSTYRSGTKAGEKKSPASVTTVNNVGLPSFDELPRLTKIMLCQVWVAHPTIRHEYMILDPNDLDYMPETLISMEIATPKVTAEVEVTSKLPWE